MEFSLVATCGCYLFSLHHHLSCSRGRRLQPIFFLSLLFFLIYTSPFPSASSHTSCARVSSQCAVGFCSVWWHTDIVCSGHLKHLLLENEAPLVICGCANTFFLPSCVYKENLGRREVLCWGVRQWPGRWHPWCSRSLCSHKTLRKAHPLSLKGALISVLSTASSLLWISVCLSFTQHNRWLIWDSLNSIWWDTTSHFS